MILKILVRIFPKLSNFGRTKLKILFWLAEGSFDGLLTLIYLFLNCFDVQKFLRPYIFSKIAYFNQQSIPYKIVTERLRTMHVPAF